MTAPSYPTDIRALTSIRYLAAAWVVFFHFSNFTASSTLIGARLCASGYLGVDFFFILSGFVLTHVYQPQIDRGRFDYWMFIAKRFGRIYPLHLVTLIFFVGLGIAASKGLFSLDGWVSGVSFASSDRPTLMRAFFANLTLIHAWGSTSGLLFNQPSWSISAEWFAYMMFPVFILLRRLPPRGEGAKLMVVAGLFLLMAAALQVALKVELTRLTWNVGILRIFPEFLMGMSLYRFGQRWSAGRRGSVAGIVLASAVVVFALYLGVWLPRFTILLTAVAVLGLAAIVLFAADADRHGMLRPMGHDFPVLLGEISYSVYMLHFGVGILLFEIAAPWWRPTGFVAATLTVLGALALVTALSWLSYRFIEVPSRRRIVRRAATLYASSGNPAA